MYLYKQKQLTVTKAGTVGLLNNCLSQTQVYEKQLAFSRSANTIMSACLGSTATCDIKFVLGQLQPLKMQEQKTLQEQQQIDINLKTVEAEITKNQFWILQ